MFKPPPDIQMPAVDPQQVASFLARHPRKIMLVSTTDGIPYEFQNDGGKVRGAFDQRQERTVFQVTLNGRAQMLYKAATSKRTDKGFADRPAFVAADDVEPAFEGDRLHTGPGGVLRKMTEEDEQTISDSKSVAAKRKVRIRAEAQAAAREFAKLTNPSAPVEGPDVAAIVADVEQRAADRERELLERIAALEAADKAPAKKRAAKKAPAKDAEPAEG